MNSTASLANPGLVGEVDSTLTPAEARAIGRDAFLWGIHPVAIYRVRYLTTQVDNARTFGGLNRLSWVRKPITAKFRGGTTPNASTMYGFAHMDLSREPVVITAPDIDDRYWSVHLHDNYANWWEMFGSQFSKPGPVRRLLVGPDWRGTLPPEFVGAEIVESPSDYAGAIVRLAITDPSPEDYAKINAFMDRITLMPLSQWIAAGRGEVSAEQMPKVRAGYPTFPGMERLPEPDKLAGMEYLQWVWAVLNDRSFTKKRDSLSEQRAFEGFARIGLREGRAFDPERLSPALREAVEAGIEDGRKAALEAFASADNPRHIDMNGWQLETDLGYRDSDWVARAGNGLIAILAPVPSRSHVLVWGSYDADGEPLDGEHNYTITFDLDDLPPVSEFWEMPLYDLFGYFVDNPINRYSLTSYMLANGKLHTEDGKLVIYVQHEAPDDPTHLRNWLPAPRDGFRFCARLYGPHGPLIDGSYRMPRIVRVR